MEVIFIIRNREFNHRVEIVNPPIGMNELLGITLFLWL